MLLFVWLSIVTLTTSGSPSMTQDFSRHISKLTRPRAKRSGRLTEAAGGIHTADLSAEPGIWITFTSKLIELLHIQINRRMRIGIFKGLILSRCDYLLWICGSATPERRQKTSTWWRTPHGLPVRWGGWRMYIDAPIEADQSKWNGKQFLPYFATKFSYNT